MDLAVATPREYCGFEHMLRFQNALAHLGQDLEPGPRAALYLVTGSEEVWGLVRSLFGRQQFLWGEVLGVGDAAVDSLILMAAALYLNDQDGSVGAQFGHLWGVLDANELRLVFNAISYYREMVD